MEKYIQEPLMQPASTKKDDFKIDNINPLIKEHGGFVNCEDRKMTDKWGKILFIPTMIIFVYIGVEGYFTG